MTAEIIRGMPADRYHAHPAIGSSNLRAALRSPLHYQASKAGLVEQTPAMRLGTLAHTATLEPERWASEYACAVRGDGRTKAIREAREAQEASGKEIVNPADYDTASLIAEAVRAHPVAADILSRIQHVERSYFWTDEATGLACKCRPDFECTDADGDLKTTADASPNAFARSVASYLYHLQNSFYVRGMRGAHPLDSTRPFFFVAAEKTPPYAVAVYELDRSAIAQGWALVRKALDTIAMCQADGRFPGYEGIRVLGLPAWASELVEEEAAQ
jgi:hypothetical protein